MSENKKYTTDPALWTEKYGDILFSYAMSRIYRRELAEDLVQETFLSALRSKESFKGESKEQTWLISILKNKIIDHYRKAGSSREKMILDQNWEYSGEESPFQQEGPFKGHWKKEAAPGRSGFSMEDMIEKEEFQRILELCVGLLPEKWAAAFTLKIMEECESTEICKDLDISSSNLWVILHRARLKVRECLEKKWMNI
jgi:RNA polymerase sigma-70 factor (ECF subfamily)